MRKLLLLTSLLTVSLGAWAQGKIDFVNDSLHLVYFSSDATLLLPADISLAGQAVPAGGVTPSGETLAADLWGGTSASSLAKLTTTTLSGLNAGMFGPVNFTSSLAAGTMAYFQVQVYDASKGSLYATAASFGYWGESSIFTMVPNGTLTYSSIVNPNAPAFSTWAPGDWNVDSSPYGPGARGAIAIRSSIPEPSSLALLALGALGLSWRRRA